ncbi:hypothetical protein Dimus_018218 [Dionaea muscipula]
MISFEAVMLSVLIFCVMGTVGSHSVGGGGGGAMVVAVAAAEPWPCRFPAIYNFGDSNSDTGGISASFLPIPWPYGSTFFHRPAGRDCDGRLLIDFIGNQSIRQAATIHHSTLHPPLLLYATLILLISIDFPFFHR